MIGATHALPPHADQRDGRWRARRRVPRGAGAPAESAGADRLDHRGPVVRHADRVLRAVSERGGLPAHPRPRGARVAAAAAGVVQRAAAGMAERVLRRRGRDHHVGESARVSARCSTPAPSSACARARRPRRSSRSCSSSSCCCATRSAGGAAARPRRSCSRRWRCRWPCRSGFAGRAICRCRRRARSLSRRRSRRTPPRVRIILLDGASLDFIRQRVAAGQLPNFGRLLERGAAIDLATLKPTQAEPVWAAAATGKYPPKDGIRSNAIYRVRADDADPVDLLPDYCFAAALHYQSFVTEEPVTSFSLRARPLWDILGDYGVVVGHRDWPLTHPARPSSGYVVSDYFDEAASAPLRLADAAGRRTRRRRPTSRATCSIAGSRARGTTSCRRSVRPSRAPTGSPAGALGSGLRAGRGRARAEVRARLTAVRYEGLDIFGHTYLARRAAGALRRVRPRRSRRDRCSIGTTRTSTPRSARRWRSSQPGDLLLVVSGFGMEQESLAKRLLARLLDWPVRSGIARTRARRLPARLRQRTSPAANSPAAPSSISRRRCSTTWACPSAATWTASRAPTLFARTYTHRTLGQVHRDARDAETAGSYREPRTTKVRYDAIAL